MDETPKFEQPVTPPPAGDDVEKGKGMAWLSYLWILWLVPLLAMKVKRARGWHGCPTEESCGWSRCWP